MRARGGLRGRLGASLAGSLLFLAAGACLADCSLAGICVAGSADCPVADCHDGQKNGSETDVDCGGECGSCDVGQACLAASDCASDHCLAGACCESPCGVWSRAYGSLVDDRATRVAVAPDGTIYVAGLFHGAVDFGGVPLVAAGGADAFLLALDPDGHHLFSVALGGSGEEQDVALALTKAGHPLLAVSSQSPSLDFAGQGLTGSGVFLGELDEHGSPVWARTYPNDGFTPKNLAVFPATGEIALLGQLGSIDLGAAGKLTSKGGIDVLLAKLGPSGDPIWARRYGDLWNDLPGDVSVNAGGVITVTVSYSRSWSFGASADGGLPDGGGILNAAIAQLTDTPAGPSLLWQAGFPSSADVTPRGLSLTPLGDLWFTGEHQAPIQFGTFSLTPGAVSSVFFVSMSHTGRVLAAESFGEHTAGGTGLVTSGAAGVYLAGHYEGNLDLGGGFRLDEGLDQLFVASFGSSKPKGLRGGRGQVTGLDSVLAIDEARHRLYVAGGFRGTLDLGSGLARSAGGADIFIAALEP